MTHDRAQRLGAVGERTYGRQVQGTSSCRRGFGDFFNSRRVGANLFGVDGQNFGLIELKEAGVRTNVAASINIAAEGCQIIAFEGLN